jgi:hypothetical protein
MLSLYFAIFHSHLTYGLPVWGSASKKLINNIALLQKRALRVITSAEFHAHTKPIMKETNILSLADQRLHQFASLLWDLDHDTLPPSLSTYFNKRNVIHGQHTRIAHDGKYNIPKTNTVTHGSSSFQVQGSLILNRLKSLDIYKNAESKTDFLKKHKKFLIDKY